MAGGDRDQTTIRKGLALIRVSSVVFIAVGAVCLALAVLLVAGVGAFAQMGYGDDGVRLIWVSLFQALFFLALGALGIRASRDRFKVRPFCVLAVILALVLAFEQLAGNYLDIQRAFTNGILGVLYLVFCVLSFISAIVSVSLIGYNRQHPRA